MTARRISIGLTILFVGFWFGLMGWSAVANPDAKVFKVQGPDSTGNLGFPVAVVQATGSTWSASNSTETTGTPSDAFAAPGAIVQTQAFPMNFGGTTWDQTRGLKAISFNGSTALTGVLACGMVISDGAHAQPWSNAGAIGDANNGATIANIAQWASNGSTFDALRDNKGAPTTLGRLAVVDGAGPMTSLNAVTSTGAGTSFNLGTAHSKFGVQITTTGSPTTVSVSLQGSLDGSTWTTMGSAITGTGTTLKGYSSEWTVAATSTNDVCEVVPYVRLNLATFSGGSSPTLTGIITAK